MYHLFDHKTFAIILNKNVYIIFEKIQIYKFHQIH